MSGVPKFLRIRQVESRECGIRFALYCQFRFRLRETDYREKFTAIRGCDGVSDVACVHFVGQESCSWHGWRLIRGEPKHAAFYRATKVGARDNFLPGVAAFFKADAVERIEIEHLRNEGFVRLGEYVRDARLKMRK